MVSDITGPAIQDAEIRRLRILLEQAWRLLAVEVKTARQEGQAAELAVVIRLMLRNGELS